MTCEYCVQKSYVYNNKCPGCRGRLVMSTYPDRTQAARMIEYLYLATRIDKTVLAQEARDWRTECTG
jgi:hypothetical protein